jgi:hypothetical protein
MDEQSRFGKAKTKWGNKWGNKMLSAAAQFPQTVLTAAACPRDRSLFA